MLHTKEPPLDSSAEMQPDRGLHCDLSHPAVRNENPDHQRHSCALSERGPPSYVDTVHGRPIDTKEKALPAIPAAIGDQHHVSNNEDASRLSRRSIPCLPEVVVVDDKEYISSTTSPHTPDVDSSFTSTASLNSAPVGPIRQNSSAAGYMARGVKGPAAVAMVLAKGFHNAPRLYGDQYVRENNKVTGIQSGLREAGRELVYGFTDGFTGLITHPIQGAVEDGPVGFARGMVSGSMGVLVKPASAAFGLVGYSLKGVHKELEKRAGIVAPKDEIHPDDSISASGTKRHGNWWKSKSKADNETSTPTPSNHSRESLNNNNSHCSHCNHCNHNTSSTSQNNLQNPLSHHSPFPPSSTASTTQDARSIYSNQVPIPELPTDPYSLIPELENTSTTTANNAPPLPSKSQYLPPPQATHQHEPLPRYELVEPSSAATAENHTAFEAAISRRSYSWGSAERITTGGNISGCDSVVNRDQSGDRKDDGVNRHPPNHHRRRSDDHPRPESHHDPQGNTVSSDGTQEMGRRGNSPVSPLHTGEAIIITEIMEDRVSPVSEISAK